MCDSRHVGITAGFDCAWQSQLSKAPSEGGHWLGQRSQEDGMNQVSGGTFVISWNGGSYMLRIYNRLRICCISLGCTSRQLSALALSYSLDPGVLTKTWEF